MKIYTVWTNKGIGVEPCQKCLKNSNGDFVCINTGKIYSKDGHYSSKQLNGRIIAVDKENSTGMYLWMLVGLTNMKHMKKIAQVGNKSLLGAM